jgi:Tfp pilus assembly protein PilV
MTRTIMTSRNNSRRRFRSRSGLSQVEILVAASLLMAGMGVLPTLGFHINRIAKESRNYQLAVHELANQLERISKLPREPMRNALRDMQLAPHVSEVLPGGTLAGILQQDSTGTRLILSLQWERTGSPPPLQLVAWVDSDAFMENDSDEAGGAP